MSTLRVYAHGEVACNACVSSASGLAIVISREGYACVKSQLCKRQTFSMSRL